MVRANKNAPSEVSSKQPVSVLREVLPVTKKKAIDPRFDRAFGHFNEDLFSKTYDFLGDTQRQEIEMLRQSLRRETDPMKRDSMRRTIERLVSMKKNKERMEQRREVIREHRKSEARLVEQGKNPYYLKKGDIKKLELAQEYERFRKRTGDSGNLDKFLEKKRKRRASKQKKFIPRDSSSHHNKDE